MSQQHLPGSDSDKSWLWMAGRKPDTADPGLNLRRRNLHAHLSDASANSADYSLEVCLDYQHHNMMNGTEKILSAVYVCLYFSVWLCEMIFII